MFTRSISSRALAHQMRKAPLLVIITPLTIVVLLAIGISARSWYRSSNASGGLESLNAQVEPSQGGRPKVRVESELITLRHDGFQPKEITRPQGRFFLAIDNRSGLEEVTLRLDHETGNRVKETKVLKEKPKWRGLLDLPPGHYLVTEADHPDWVCRLTITAR
jgi:hypothetical protein